MIKLLYTFLVISFISIYPLDKPITFPSAKETFKYLNQDPENPFVVSFGMSEAQASFQSLDNTANPQFILTKLQKMAQKESNPRAWLENKDRIWYILRSLPKIQCKQCGVIIDPETFDLKRDHVLITSILDDIAANKNALMLSMTKCPSCNSNKIITLPKQYPKLTEYHQKAIISQIDALGIFKQLGCQKKYHLPCYRYSLESSNILKDNSLDIDQTKLDKLAQFIKDLGDPIIFLHNYTNPLAIPNLFEEAEHINWFANYCAQVIKAFPNVTHVCPIVQPIAFAYRVGRNHNLPPFAINIGLNDYLSNIVKADIEACKKIKQINPAIKTLVSHQWKIMRPKHSFYDFRWSLEKFVCGLADYMYNQKFVALFKPYSDYFDGISLSLYPPLEFNGWTPEGDNVSGVIDLEAALQAIMEIHKAFPNKDIYIGETSCNVFEPKKQREFIDMTLYACKLARDKGVPVKGVYFWSHSNDFYSEWNKPPHSTNLAPFNQLRIDNPFEYMNAAGKYIHEILS